jgi:hypothetical protein
MTRHDVLVAAGLNLPRFDTAGSAAFNLLAIGVFVLAVTLLALRRRSGCQLTPWAWPLCLGNAAYGRIYLPVGPLIVLLILGFDRMRTSVREESSQA